MIAVVTCVESCNTTEKQEYNTGMKVKHEWKFDLPWHMVRLRDWFYMVNSGYIAPVHFLHVRVFGLRSLWMIELPPQDIRRTDVAEMNLQEILGKMVR